MYNLAPEFAPQWSGLEIPVREYIDNVFDHIVHILCEVNHISEKNFDGYDKMSGLVREFFDNSPEVIAVIEEYDGDARHTYCAEFIYYTYFSCNGADVLRSEEGDNAIDYEDDVTFFVVLEKRSEQKDANISIDTARKVGKEMRELIRPCLNSNSKYGNGMFTYLTPPNGLKTKFGFLAFSADKDGFFVHTHRARTKSFIDPEKIPQDKINFVKSTS